MLICISGQIYFVYRSSYVFMLNLSSGPVIIFWGLSVKCMNASQSATQGCIYHSTELLIERYLVWAHVLWHFFLYGDFTSVVTSKVISGIYISFRLLPLSITAVQSKIKYVGHKQNNEYLFEMWYCHIKFLPSIWLLYNTSWHTEILNVKTTSLWLIILDQYSIYSVF